MPKNRKHIIILILSFLVYKIDAQQGNIKNISRENGLPSNIIFDIKQDQIGYLWIATDKGLIKYDGDDFNQINNLKTTHIQISNEIVYSGIENGLFIKNKKKEQFVESKKVLKIYSFENNIFVGTTEGVYSLKDNDLKPIKLNSIIDFSVVNDILFFNNSFYLATNTGLWVIDNLLKPKSIQKITEESINYLEKFQNHIISSTYNDELLLFEKKSFIKRIKTIENITSISKLKNEIWITSSTDGIEIFSLPSFSFKQKINKYNSLQTNVIYSIFRDNQNSTFISSEKGIYILSNNPIKNKTNTAPSIYFENIQINHKNSDSLFLIKKNKLSPYHNNISISFKTINLLNPKKVQYRYRLNDQFSPWSNNNSIQYPNLRAGQYKFEIQSKIENVKSTIKSFSFSIDKPFYKKTWFYFTILITLLIVSYFSLHYYILKINRINKEKINKLKLKNQILSLEQKALQLQMNPHFIFNVLNGIKALGNSGKIDELNTTVSKFSVLLRGILNNSRKEEITLLEEIELLKNYIELEQIMSSNHFSYTIKQNLNNIDPDEIIIPTMLLQPFVENSIQHAFNKNTEGKIEIKFEVKHRFLEITIIDNGIGINQSKLNNTNFNHKSIALKVTKERLQIITTKNSLKIKELKESDEIKGTMVSFRIPLKTDY